MYISGPDLANQIYEELSAVGIGPEQYLGGAYDGQYFHCNVPQILDEKFGFTGDSCKHSDWDPLHRAGTEDKHMRQDPNFLWLVQVTDVCTLAFKTINFGAEFEHFYEVCDRLKNDDSFTAAVYSGLPCFFSATRFANHCAKVFQTLRKDYPGLLVTLAETQEKNCTGDSKQREKAANAAEIKNKLMNKKFVLQLSGVVDIYTVFGHGVNVLQTLNMLPHDKYDRFNQVCVNKLKSMLNTISSHKKCPKNDKGNTICDWPCFHSDSESLTKTLEYRGIIIIDDFQKLVNTRENARNNLQDELKGVLPLVISQLTGMAKHLHTSLSTQIFKADDLVHLKNIRTVLNVGPLAQRVKARGVPTIAAIDTKPFIQSAKKLASNLRDVPDAELKIQFRTFLTRLTDASKDIDCTNLAKSNIKLIQIFLDTKKELYVGIELIMHALSVACVSMSIESIIESQISTYEALFPKNRTPSEKRGKQEMVIKLNGPNLAHSTPLLKQSLDKYFGEKKKSKWHFTKAERHIDSYNISRVLERNLNEKSKLPFMDA